MHLQNLTLRYQLLAYEINAQGWKKRLGLDGVGGWGGGGGCIYKIVITKGGTIFLCNYLGGSFDTPNFSEPLPWDVKNDQSLILLLNQNPSLHNSCDAKN